MIKIKERKRMAHIIYKDIIKRLQELAVRSEEHSLNDAYFIAFQVGLEADIEDSLKKLNKEVCTNEQNCE